LLYAISAKRYALFTIDKNSKIEIKETDKDEDYSLHGLGHLLNPFGKKEGHWQKEIWIDMLELEHGLITEQEFLDKYRNFYAISQFTISTTRLMNRFKRLNKKKSYNDSIKPFNFMLIGFSNDKNIKPIAPFSSDPQSMPHGEFIDYKTGRLMNGQHYFKNLADELSDYRDHPEAKLEGTVGLLQRRHITVDKIMYIGKEADKIEDNLSGLDNVNYNVYDNPEQIKGFFLKKWKEVKSSGISRRQFYDRKKQIKAGKIPKLSGKVLRKILHYF
jgi:hypothetical protein